LKVFHCGDFRRNSGMFALQGEMVCALVHRISEDRQEAPVSRASAFASALG
jgi:hypothetical protein